jgi:hypothetical protein
MRASHSRHRAATGASSPDAGRMAGAPAARERDGRQWSSPWGLGTQGQFPAVKLCDRIRGVDGAHPSLPEPPRLRPREEVMDWLVGNTSIAGIQIRNWWIVMGAVIALFLLTYPM